VIDPLRPYWPTNRSIAGLLVRGACLLAATVPFVLSIPRPTAILFALAAGVGQAFFLAFEWMELKKAARAATWGAATLAILFIPLIVVLVLEARSILVLSVR
jgi:hypothetical protein